MFYPIPSRFYPLFLFPDFFALSISLEKARSRLLSLEAKELADFVSCTYYNVWCASCTGRVILDSVKWCNCNFDRKRELSV